MTVPAVTQSEKADSTVLNNLRDISNTPEKGTADARWPTVVFASAMGRLVESNARSVPLGGLEVIAISKSHSLFFRASHLTAKEKQIFVNARTTLKNEMGLWSILIGEPINYTALLQNVIPTTTS